MGIVHSEVFNVTNHHHDDDEEQDDEVEEEEEDVYEMGTLFEEEIDRKRWNSVIRIAKSDIGRQEARKYCKNFADEIGGDMLPLGYACDKNAPSAVIEAIFKAYPEAIKVECYFPAIHEAVETYELDIRLMELLLQSEPKKVLMMKDSDDNLPIHSLFCNSRVTLDMVRFFLDLNPDCISIPNDSGCLPLHFACEMLKTDSEDVEESIVMALVKAYPAALLQRAGRDGRLPIHCAVSRNNPSPKVIQHLINESPESLRVKDLNGHCPIHLLCGALLPEEYADYRVLGMSGLSQILTKPPEDTVVKIMKALLHAIPNSIIWTATRGVCDRDSNKKKDETLYNPGQIAMLFYGTSYPKLMSLLKFYEQFFFVSRAFDVINKATPKSGQKRKFSHMVGFND